MTSSPQHQLPDRLTLTTRRRQPAQEAQSRSRSSITIRATRSPAAAPSSTCPSHGTAVSQLGQCTLTTGRLVSSSLLSSFRYPVGNAIQSRLTSPSSWIGYSVSQLLGRALIMESEVSCSTDCKVHCDPRALHPPKASTAVNGILKIQESHATRRFRGTKKGLA